MNEIYFVISLSNKELDKELKRLRELPIQKVEIKKGRKKKKKSFEEIQVEINKILGVSEEDILKKKLRDVLIG